MSTTSVRQASKLYQNLEVLQTGRRDQLLLPFHCYPHLDDVPAVAVAHFEAWHLAMTCPILWRDCGETALELCALVTRPVFSQVRTHESRPRLVVAYPLAPAWIHGADRDDLTVMYDRAPEPLPPDVSGKAVLDAMGGFTTAAQKRIEALFLYAAGLSVTRTLTRELMAQDMLQPWNVSLRFGDHARPLMGAYRLADDWCGRFDRSRLPDNLLPRFQELVQAHLISIRHPDLSHESANS